MKECSEYRTEEELQNVKDFQNAMSELEKILNKNQESPDIEIEKQKCTSKLLFYKRKVLQDYEKEKDILRNAEKTGEILKKDYDWIRKYLNNINVKNDFQEINDEIIKLDDELRYKIGKAVIQIRKYNSTQTYEHYMNTKIPPLEQKNILNMYSMGNTIEKIIRREEKYVNEDDYKRFFSIANKHLVFYSEKSGFYKYFKNVIEYLIKHSNVIIHYVTNDPKDKIFEFAKAQPHIKPPPRTVYRLSQASVC